MNDLIERYIYAVCAYFYGPKRKKVYMDLKQNIYNSYHSNKDAEKLLLEYGHPRSVAYCYGYREIFEHIFNPKIVSLIELFIFFFSIIYLFFSTLYYLYCLNCLPFQTSIQPYPIINSTNILSLFLCYPFFVIGIVTIVSAAILFILDYKYPVSQARNLSWNKEQLYNLPYPNYYPNHYIESLLMLVFCLYFLTYSIFFTQDFIMKIQHESYQMIHLMIYFFQPYIMIIIVDYFIDLTKKAYSKNYLKCSNIINIFIFLSLSLFVYNSHFLKDYLLPINLNKFYILINFFIIGALFFIYLMSIYKLLRNIKSYYSLFKD